MLLIAATRSSEDSRRGRDAIPAARTRSVGGITMTKISVGMVKARDFGTLSDADFERIEAAANELEKKGRVRLSDGYLRKRIADIVRNYANDRIADRDSPSWVMIRNLIRPIEKASSALVLATSRVTSTYNKPEKLKQAMHVAEHLVSAHYRPEGPNFIILAQNLRKLHKAAAEALADGDKFGWNRKGREKDLPLQICLSELRCVYRHAGGRSIKPRSIIRESTRDVVDTKKSGFVNFAHECLRGLPGDIYPYRHQSRQGAMALAQQVTRSMQRDRRRGTGGSDGQEENIRGSLVDALIAARMEKVENRGGGGKNAPGCT